jgi:CBS domain-containing protein
MGKRVTVSPTKIKYSKVTAARTFEEPYIIDADYLLSEVRGIRGPHYRKLRRAGIVTTKDLLKYCLSPVARNAFGKETGIEPYLLLKWTRMADLMRVEGVGQQYAELLVLAGIDSMKKLSSADPRKIIKSLQTPGLLPVKNLKIDDEYDIVDGKSTLREAAKEMVEKNLPDLVVCEGKKPTGILTFRGIVRAMAEGMNVDKVKVEEVIVKDTPTLGPMTTIEKAAELLIEKSLPVLPVVDLQGLIGVVSRRDIEEVFVNMAQRRPSYDEVERWCEDAKRHKPVNIR